MAKTIIGGTKNKGNQPQRREGTQSSGAAPKTALPQKNPTSTKETGEGNFTAETRRGAEKRRDSKDEETDPSPVGGGRGGLLQSREGPRYKGRSTFVFELLSWSQK